MAETVLNVTVPEKKCIFVLAKLFNEGNIFMSSNAINVLQEEGLEIPDEQSFVVLMRMMEKYNVIDKARHSTERYFFNFSISPTAVQLAREIEHQEKKLQEPRDIVSQVTETARKHPVAAWLIIFFIGLTTVLAFVNQVIQLLRNIGVID